MTELQKQHNSVLDNESFILEECHYCGTELENINDILVDSYDNYCCRDCNTYYNLNAKECIDIISIN